MSYTLAAAAGVLTAVALDVVILRTRLLGRRAFWVSYVIVLVGQLVVNGVLTGRGVVDYDPAAILGVRVVFAPVEDLAFGFSLVLQTLAWWTYWGRRCVDRARAARTPAGPATRSRRASDT